MTGFQDPACFFSPLVESPHKHTCRNMKGPAKFVHYKAHSHFVKLPFLVQRARYAPGSNYRAEMEKSSEDKVWGENFHPFPVVFASNHREQQEFGTKSNFGSHFENFFSIVASPMDNTADQRMKGKQTHA